MERLTERNKDGKAITKTLEFQYLIDKLAEYEQAEEDGLLIKLPCRVGDTLYTFNLIKDEVFEFRAESKRFIVDILEYGLLGKTTFLTKAEAEQALAKMKGE